jgi:hypothetical protein
VFITASKFVGLHFGRIFHKLIWSLCCQLQIIKGTPTVLSNKADMAREHKNGEIIQKKHIEACCNTSTNKKSKHN